jgi:hypothetical protein
MRIQSLFRLSILVFTATTIPAFGETVTDPVTPGAYDGANGGPGADGAPGGNASAIANG